MIAGLGTHFRNKKTEAEPFITNTGLTAAGGVKNFETTRSGKDANVGCVLDVAEVSCATSSPAPLPEANEKLQVQESLLCT